MGVWSELLTPCALMPWFDYLKMKDEKNTFIEGTITENLPNTMFRVEVGEDRTILATLKGSLRRRYVRIFPGDRVRVEMTRYDTERGRIVAKLNR